MKEDLSMQQRPQPQDEDWDAARIKMPVEPFRQTLAKHGLTLTREKITTLQVNVGLLCNQACRHCHLEAGPNREEVMSKETVDQVVAVAQRFRFEVIDITGGAPEMTPDIVDMILRLAPLTSRLMLRSNLTALARERRADLIDLCKQNRVIIVASFPSLNEAQAESQRGRGVFQESIDVLRKLNSVGYGRPGSGLELNLVSNPTGAFLPSSQEQLEKRFCQVLENKWGIVFNNLFAFANVPLGRFRLWLEKSGNLDKYLQKLATSFNPCAIEGLMCRSLISVSWEGYLFDCDFNQAAGLYLGTRKTHISELKELPARGEPIAISSHCYTCTAGSGFT
ncbi:MAG: arsenosugar biosynthesis radical SAM protein ArsS [Deltaproteobacteria bacterium]|nr:arsenosugar biosynthesis radical SAM protein ArsS [Deltaproteobacteria bacterium]